MKKMLSALMVGAALALAATAPDAMAVDKGPQYVDSTIRTNSTTVAIPIGETGRFTPTWLALTRVPAGSTQAISYVASGVTGVISAATTATLIAITNVPPMFYGDYFVVAPGGLTSTNTFRVRAIGNVYD